MRLVGRYLFFIVSLFLFNEACGAPPQDRPNFSIKRAKDLIKLDGTLDEESWKEAAVVSDLIQQFPYDTSRSKVRTEFRATSDDHFLYFSAVAYDNVKGGYVI